MISTPAFPRTHAAIEAGLTDGTHLGAQIYVSVDGDTLLDTAFGEAQKGVPATPESIMLWFSAGKPLTAIAIAQQVEASRIRWETRVAELIPEFGTHGKDRITINHVLTHTAGLHAIDPMHAAAWDEQIARICAMPLPHGWVVGQRAAYSAKAGWYILGEIIQRCSGETFADYMRRHVAGPAGLVGTHLAIPSGGIDDLRSQLGFIYDTQTENPQSIVSWNSDEGLHRCVPGGSTRAPARDIGRVYEILLRGGSPLLSTATVNRMTSAHRTSILDETFQYKIVSGLGFILNSNRDGIQMPYGYGREASAATFGHSGNQCSCAFADPEHRIVAAWVCNGMPGERRHQQRQRAINNAIYEDLGVAQSFSG